MARKTGFALELAEDGPQYVGKVYLKDYIYFQVGYYRNFTRLLFHCEAGAQHSSSDSGHQVHHWADLLLSLLENVYIH